MNSALQIRNLKKSYGNFLAIKNLSLDIKEGEIFGLLGPNGAGKTTILSCVEGVTTFDSGTIEIFGHTISQGESLSSIIGVQLQSSSLPKNITVLEAMTLICKWQNVMIRKDLLDTFGLKDKYNKQYSSLSTGLKRRLHLALAIAHNPKIVFLDEPTAGLDVEGRISLHKEIRKLNKEGITIILASHDMAEVESLCDRIAIIVKGDIAALGTPNEISKVGNGNTKLVLKTNNNSITLTTKLENSKIIASNSDYIDILCKDLTTGLSELLSIITKNNDKIQDLKIEKLSLEERFMEIINEKENK